MLIPAKILFACVVMNLFAFVVLLFPFFSDKYKLWMYKQICYSGDDLYFDESTYQWAGDYRCENDSTKNNIDYEENIMNTISYAPLLAYCNMFSIYYLEVISNTKLLAKKNATDSTMGKSVNWFVCGFYVFLFALVWLIQLIKDQTT